MKTLSLTRPDDFHVHLRDHALLTLTAPYTAKIFKRALLMPNLSPPLVATTQVDAYHIKVLSALQFASKNEKNLLTPKELQRLNTFSPLFALYLQENTPLAQIKKVANHPSILGFKLYPAGATTNSHLGVAKFEKLYPFFATMEKYNVPLLLHGETVNENVDVFDRERYFIDKTLTPISENFPNLKITLEHISTKEAVSFVRQAPHHIKATITPQHLILNRNAIFANGLNPHHYCLPLLKHEKHRLAVLKAATSNNDKFFLGTDSAPHPENNKLATQGCAGIFSAPLALPLYTAIFEKTNALHQLNAFTSIRGAKHYGLPLTQEKITLINKPPNIPPHFTYFEKNSEKKLIPFTLNPENPNPLPLNWSLLN